MEQDEGQATHHAGPKMGVGRFQLGFLSVLYLQRRGNNESCPKYPPI